MRCARCAEVCPTSALSRIGKYYTPKNLARILLRDRPFYRHSNGGVTLSGGECTLYPDYVSAVLSILREEHIHVTVETSGYFSFDSFHRQILPYIDLIYFDIKFASSSAHKKHTGQSNVRILKNLESLLSLGTVPVLPRVPLVPGVTDTKENLDGIIKILRSLGADEVKLLPYNPMGIEMARALGRSAPPVQECFDTPERTARTRELFQQLLAG